MRWPWTKAPVEKRQATSYTSLLVDSLVRAADGTDASGVGALAALETAAGCYARAFAGASVSPSTPTTRALTPSVLSAIARRLIRRGESLHTIHVDTDGAVSLIEASHWDPQGPVPENEWVYQTTLTGPSSTTTRWLPSAAVVHCRYATSEQQPHRGISPIAWAHSTGRLAALLERSLADEAGGPVGTLLPIPEGQTEPTGDDGDLDGADPLAALRADLAALRGSVALLETQAGGFGDRGGRPDSDWKGRRLGPDPPETLAALRSGAALSILAACGIPLSLAALPADGSAQRESYRRFLHSSVVPLGRLVEAELKAKLDVPDLRLDFSDLAAADWASRARAWRSLVGAEAALDPDVAARLVLGMPDDN